MSYVCFHSCHTTRHVYVTSPKALQWSLLIIYTAYHDHLFLSEFIIICNETISNCQTSQLRKIGLFHECSHVQTLPRACPTISCIRLVIVLYIYIYIYIYTLVVNNFNRKCNGLKFNSLDLLHNYLCALMMSRLCRWLQCTHLE